MRKQILAVLIAVSTAALCGAHDLVLFPEGGGAPLRVVAKYGHPGEYSTAALQKIIDFRAIGPSGVARSWLGQIKESGADLAAQPSASLEPGIWIFAARYDNGYFVKTKDGRYVNTSKLEYPQAAESMHSVKFAKTIVQLGAGNGQCSQPVGLRLELIPQTNPLSLKEGHELPVEVLYDGKPLKGVGVEIGDGKTPMKEEQIQRYKTDANGIAKVPIHQKGLQLIAVDYKFPSSQKALADDESYSSTLTFILPQ